MQAAFAKYEDARRTEVLRLQSAARNSMEWFEDVERYLHLDPVQFNYSLLTRSQRISHENLRLRDKNWLEGAEAWFQRLAGAGDNIDPAADVRAVQAARHAAQEPRRGLADGAIQSRRRLPDRLAPRALRRARQRRRRSRLHRDDLRQPGRPHHARLHRHVRAGARGGVEAHRRFRPCRDRRENLLPARPFRRQGLDPARLGGNGRAAEARQLAGDVGVGDRLVGAQPARPRDGPRRHGPRARPIRRVRPKWRRAPTSTCSKSIARTAICFPPSSRR